MSKSIYNFETIKHNLCLSVLVYNIENKKFNTERFEKINNISLINDVHLIINNNTISFIFENKLELLCVIFVDHDKKTINIVFKGSDDLNDILQDLKTIKRCAFKDDDSSIHAGFIDILTTEAVHEDVLRTTISILKDLPEYELFITGHSLGGALATVFGYYISKKIEKTINIITFGSPRVGDFKFYENFNKIQNISLLRVVNDNDIIVSLPKINYYHVGKVLELNECSIDVYDSKNAGYFKNSILSNYSLNDHFCVNYYDNLLVNSKNI